MHVLHSVRDSPYFFFQAEDGIRDLVRSRGLGDVYKRQVQVRDDGPRVEEDASQARKFRSRIVVRKAGADLPSLEIEPASACLLYTSDAADERSSVDLGGRRIIKKKKTITTPDRIHNEDKKRSDKIRTTHTQTLQTIS